MKYTQPQKAVFVLLTLLIMVFSVANFALAADRPLEGQYPSLPGATTPTTVKTPLPDYINYIFNFSLWIGGLLVFGMMILGGFRWFSSRGSAEVINDAKDQIFSAFLGLVILLSSYIILNTINPQLTLLKVEIGTPPKINIPTITGVYFGTKDAIWDNNQKSDKWTDANKGDISDFKNFLDNEPIKKIHYVNENQDKWTAILHNDTGYEGSCRIFLKNSDDVIGKGNKDGEVYGEISKVNSATIFNRNEVGWGNAGAIQLCKEPNYQQCVVVPDTEIGKMLTFDDNNGKNKSFENNINSIKINGNYLVALFEKNDASGICEVFRASDSDFKNDPIGQCGFWPFYESCVSSFAFFPIK